MTTSAFEYHAPSSAGEAVALLAQHGDAAKILAGGHSLVPLMKTRLARPEVIIDLGKVQGMSYVRDEKGGLAIGAMTTYYQIESSDLVQSRAPALSDAASVVADPQVRNMGTIGGSLAHSDPAADLPAVVIALRASVITSSSGEHRTIEADDLFVDLLTTSLRSDEILSEIRIPASAEGSGSAYVKFANKASHFAIVGVAASVTLGPDGSCRDVSIGITGAGASASRASAAEAALRGGKADDDSIRAAAAEAGAGIDFNDDVHASASYREHLTKVFAERALKAAVARAG